MTAIGRQEILRLIPHAGEMCLLDEILGWDGRFLRGTSRRFGEQQNPMRREDGTLGMACGIEAAGQAMAAHGRLIAGSDLPPQSGMLVSLRDVELSAGPLGTEALMIEVERLLGDVDGASYKFSVANSAGALLSGRATVIFAGNE